MSNKIEIYLSKIIKYGLYAVLFTPLAFWPQTLYAFLTPKFILFQILVEVVFGTWLILLLRRRGFSQIIADLRRNYIILALLLFLAVSFISALFGIDISRSFWGIGARMTGLFAELHFLAWFLVLISVFRSGSTRIETNQCGSEKYQHESVLNPRISAFTYINFSFAISIGVALTAFYQNVTWHLVPGYTIFSNPTFVAPYFSFHFFWGLYQIWNSKSYNKLFFGIGDALILTALILGQIRGAFLGLLAGIAFLGLGLILANILKPRSRIVVSAFYALVIIGLVLVWQFRESRFIQNSYFNKLTAVSFMETTAQTRLLTWQSAIKGIWDRPLFGFGPENFNYLFNAHYNPKLLLYGGSSFVETWQDKPHNIFLEIPSETGIVGSLAYIFLWFSAGFALFGMFRKGRKFLSLALAATFISYLFSMFFSFDSFGSWFGLFLFLAFLNSFYKNEIVANQEDSSKNKINGLAAAGIIIIIVIAYLIILNYSIWQANIADADAIRYFGRDPIMGINLFEKSLSYFSPYKWEYQFDLIASVAGAVDKGISLPNLEETINFALDESNKAVSAHPKDAASYTSMLLAYNILGAHGRDPQILAQAEALGRKSLELSPNRQETLLYLARTELLKNNAGAAVELTKKAVDIDPQIRISHWYLGLSYIANNQKNEGITEIKKALELGYQPQNQNEANFIRNLGL